jgi:uncharacterized protein YkwD
LAVKKFGRLSVPCLAVAVVVLSCAASALACAGAETGPAGQSEHSYADAIVCLVNHQRARMGLSAVVTEARLARAASRFSITMVKEGFFGHVAPDGSTVADRVRRAGYHRSTVAETLGWGSGRLARPAAIVAGWMASPPHRSIVLGARFRKLGVGSATEPGPGGMVAATVTADFGR